MEPLKPFQPTLRIAKLFQLHPWTSPLDFTPGLHLKIASGATTAEQRRAQYFNYLSHRLATAVNFEREAIRAQSLV